MKKTVKNLLAAFALVAALGPWRPAMAVSISSTTRAASIPPILSVRDHESADWSVIGTGTGTVHLERSKGTDNWEILGTSVTTGNINWSGIVESGDRAFNYRFRVSTITANYYTFTLSDRDDPVQSFDNNKGVKILQLNDDSVHVFGNIDSDGIQPSTATTSGNSTGKSMPAYLGGSVAAVEGSVLVATTPVANYGFAVIVSPATADLTNWAGIAKSAAATGTVVGVYYEGFVLARTTGTVVPGDTLVTTTNSAGYLGADSTPTTGADVGIALSGGTAAGGLTKIRLR